MTVFVNDEILEFSDTPTLIKIFEIQQITEIRGLAVAINEEVIPRVLWTETLLQNNDRLMLIRATQGG
ncbi:sulfur carrier protein ThiS [Arcicella sp. DC2W]|uniref:Sulfur carrier protein ThiS n=1 Tax=Arcicella gelida TaxID=2984195 RepID=A0ABU5S4K2_9BACT|nr:sulfur carrier protein ThiS [Arcicella sp. DC2W]MEA5403371.1 sulfur carrier protein ThiS [Arcicella sp. DC2W]